MKSNLLLTVISICLFAACQPTPPPSATSSASAGSNAAERDYFDISRDYLAKLDEYDPKQGMVQTAYYLNRWLARSQEQVAWQRDAMLDELPTELRSIPPLQALDKREFTVEDVRYLRQASWARSISKWVAQGPNPLELSRWLKQLEQARGEPHAYEVSLAARLFDWTVRNIQLSPLLPFPAQTAGPVGTPNASPLQQATPGPGYTAFPWQTLLYGQGDAWQRARIFMLLCRQQQIDTVMLAFDDLRSSPRPRPWLPAVLIDDQLYLFDTRLGLPIRGPGGAGIATLAQVRQDPGILRALDVGTELRYAEADADWAQLVALIDASPEALSYRAKAFELEAAAGEPLFVTVAAEELAKRLKSQAQITAVDLWRIPFQAWVYREALGARAQEDPEAMRRLWYDEMILENVHPLTQGRTQYFRGNFEKTDDNPGAKGYFVEARVPDTFISQIESSPEVQASLGMVRTRENDQEWRYRLQIAKGMTIGIKQTATYWLGMIHYETGHFDTAVTWLKQRTLDASDQNPWKPGARLNLARVYEAQGDLELARKTLLLDDSPQRHGNLLLARYLRENMERQAKSKTPDK
ncbi:MAG: tetratricopeptide repeat protein [Candidatus Anammoximicrobium sp.]|nr:tetratricopeptide repeat protein [Candidatus Anammoximicrobium sp.]